MIYLRLRWTKITLYSPFYNILQERFDLNHTIYLIFLLQKYQLIMFASYIHKKIIASYYIAIQNSYHYRLLYNFFC